MNEPAVYDRDAEHLSLLRIFQYIYGGLKIAFSSLFLFHTIAGVMLYLNPDILPPAKIEHEHAPPPAEIWLFMAIVAGSFVLIGWIFGVLNIVSGWMIAKRRHRIFTMVVAGIDCMFIPIGTALGVCTLLVLNRDSVRYLYADAADALPAPGPT